MKSDASENLKRWREGQIVFREGDPPCGVYILHAGEVDLLSASSKASVKLQRVSEAGRMLGLSAVLAGMPHDSTAVTRTACRTAFMDREAFLRSLENNPATWFSVLRLLSSDVNAAYDTMRSLAMK